MAAFYHFLVGARKADVIDTNKFKPEALAKWGLDAVLSDIDVVPDECVVNQLQRGPDPKGSPGLLLYPKPVDRAQRPDPKFYNYDPNKQTFIKSSDGKERYIGWLNDKPPSPKDLERKNLTATKWIVFDDRGASWVVVTARTSDNGTLLPGYYYFSDDGKTMQNRIKDEYMSLWELSGAVADHCAALCVPPDQRTDETNAYVRPEEWLVRTAITCLGVNYRLGPGEMRAMIESGIGLVDEVRVADITSALIDNHLVRDWEQWKEAVVKKNSSDPKAKCSSVSPGSEESTVATSPVEAAS